MKNMPNLQRFIGKKYDDVVTDLEATIGRHYRLIRPGFFYTLEVDPTRMNVKIDRSGTIVDFYRG